MVLVRDMKTEDIERVWHINIGDYAHLHTSGKQFAVEKLDQINKGMLHHFDSVANNNQGLVVSIGGIVGYAIYDFSLFYNRVDLIDLFVQKDFRGFGLGRALVSGVATKAVKKGCYSMMTSLPTNETEQAYWFYSNLGFHFRDWRGFHYNLSDLANIYSAV